MAGPAKRGLSALRLHFGGGEHWARQLSQLRQTAASHWNMFRWMTLRIWSGFVWRRFCGARRMNRRERFERRWRKCAELPSVLFDIPIKAGGSRGEIVDASPGSPGINAAERRKVERSRRLQHALQSESSKRCVTLFASERNHDFVTLMRGLPGRLRSPDRQLISLFAELQAKLLALLHRFSIDDGKVRSLSIVIELREKRAGRQVRTGSRTFGPGLSNRSAKMGSRPLASMSKATCFSAPSLGTGSAARLRQARKLAQAKK